MNHGNIKFLSQRFDNIPIITLQYNVYLYKAPTNFASNYEKYHYWLDKQRRKSPSRSSGNRSVSPLSVRAAAPSEAQIVEELKQLRRKKEMEYEAAANAQLRSPPNQERIRRVIDESRRMEAHMKS